MRVGLLMASSISEFRLKTLKPILEDKRFSVEVAIIDKRKKSLKEKIIKNLKKGRGGYIIIMALEKLFFKKEYEKSYDTKKFCKEHKITYIETLDPYSNEVLETIKKHNIDVLLLVGGFGIIKEPLLVATPLGVLSYHHGDMRKYRGQPPVFWELYNNEKAIGVTLQRLSKLLDAGEVICEKHLKIYPSDTLRSLEKRLRDESIDMMYEALIKLLNKEFQAKKIEQLGKVYTLPNLREWIVFQIKMFFRRVKRNVREN